MRHTQLVHFKDEEFDVETALTIDEAKELLKTGFDYITEKNGVMLFRRHKDSQVWSIQTRVRGYNCFLFHCEGFLSMDAVCFQWL